MKITMFGSAKSIETQIDEYLNTVSQAAILFSQIIARYVSHGADPTFEERRSQLKSSESNGNQLARTIGMSLYTDMLIPDSRGDVLSLLQDLDYLLDLLDKIAAAIDVERPEIGDIKEGYKEDFKELAATAVESVEAAVQTARAFFKDLTAVADHGHKIGFYEAQVDELALRLKKDIFGSNLPLERKMQLRHFVDLLDDLADEAEDVGDWISIYTIKRSL